MATKVFEKLMQVQSRLRAPKDCENKFGGYKYRKAEDILEAVKPLLADVGAVVRIDDTIAQVGDRFYVRANAAFIDVADGECVCSCAYAREPQEKKGMDAAQVTGATSSYARKYALNGLFAIDDSSDDPDVTNRHGADDRGKNATAQNANSAPQSAPQAQGVSSATAKAPSAPSAVSARPAQSSAKKEVNPLARQAWADFKSLPLAKTLTDAKRNESFKFLLKEQVGKLDTASLTADDWHKVINHISVLSAM